MHLRIIGCPGYHMDPLSSKGAVKSATSGTVDIALKLHKDPNDRKVNPYENKFNPPNSKGKPGAASIHRASIDLRGECTTQRGRCSAGPPALNSFSYWKNLRKMNKDGSFSKAKSCLPGLTMAPILQAKNTHNYVNIIVGGSLFKTLADTVKRFPDSLLASKDCAAYYCKKREAYVFPTRCRISFENILYFYQSYGYLSCPKNVEMLSFKREVAFFRLPKESMDRCEYGKVLDMVIAAESESEPKNTLSRWSKQLVKSGSWYKTIVGSVDMAATVVYILILIMMTDDNFVNIPTAWKIILSHISAVCVIWFILHYIINYLNSEDTKSYCLGIMSIIDILVVSSFAVEFIFERIFISEKDWIKKLTGVRILIGVVRQLCIARYSNLLYCLAMALKNSGKDLLHIFYLLIIVILVFSSGAYFFEMGTVEKTHHNRTSNETSVEWEDSTFTSIPASLWWGFITITSVGYGDMSPHTSGGKMITAVLALTGIPLIAIPLPLIMTQFNDLYEKKKAEALDEESAKALLKKRAEQRKSPNTPKISVTVSLQEATASEQLDDVESLAESLMELNAYSSISKAKKKGYGYHRAPLNVQLTPNFEQLH